MVRNPISSRRRDRLSIIAEILDKAREGVLKTRIMYKANLSFAQINEYLSLIVDLDLLEVAKNPEKTIYKTTHRGLQYLQGYKEIRELLTNGKENDLKDVNSLHLVKRGTRVILL
ncbi:MAG: winged helix-turn-helix domain-containing protein [Candidatus Bathyarchaeia archaeon]